MFTTLMGTAAMENAAAAVAAAESAAPDLDKTRLIIFAISGIALLIVLITWAKMHPFVALFIGALTIGIGAGFGAVPTTESFASGFGATMASVGILVGLGAMFGRVLADSGGADRIVDTLVAHASPKALPWVIAVVGALIGLPMFFEVGLVLLIPVILLVARRSGVKLMRIAVPTLAGLSVMHGLVPPHPGPLAAISSFENADLGTTLMFGVIVAIPTLVIAGPLFFTVAAKWVDVPVPNTVVTEENSAPETVKDRPRPSFVASVICILLPVALMLARSINQIIDPVQTDSAGNEGRHETVAARLLARKGHFMPASLLDSQFAILEPLGDDEQHIDVDLNLKRTPDQEAQAVLDELGLKPSTGESASTPQ